MLGVGGCCRCFCGLVGMCYTDLFASLLWVYYWIVVVTVGACLLLGCLLRFALCFLLLFSGYMVIGCCIVVNVLLFVL